MRQVRSMLRGERVEPEDPGGVQRVGPPGDAVVPDRTRQEVHPEVRPAARLEQLLDLLVGLPQADRRVELDATRSGTRTPIRAAQLTDDDLGDQRRRPLPGAAELDDVHAVVVRLDQPRQRAALAQRRDVPGRR